MSNSSLVNITMLSPNNSGQRKEKISRLTIHCVVGQLSAKSVLEMFSKKSRKASSNYVIGKDGEIGLCVEETNRSWCSSSNYNDQRAITIEVASDSKHPYTFNNKAYDSLINLTIDIMKRNNKNKLIYIEDKEKALKYQPEDNELLITFHRWYSNKECPGDWFINKTNSFVETINNKLNVEVKADKTQYYIVKRGDTLYKIGKMFNVDYKKIAIDNKIKNHNIIRVGEKLIIKGE